MDLCLMEMALSDEHDCCLRCKYYSDELGCMAEPHQSFEERDCQDE